MHEPPQIAVSTIVAALRDHYRISIAALSFLPLGNDSGSAVYRVDAATGATYFLKLRRRREFSAASVAVPRYLHELGVPHIIAPLLSTSQKPFVTVDDFAFTLYRFIDGRIGGDCGLSDQHWTALGRMLKQVHAQRLPDHLVRIVGRETFTPYRRDVVIDLEDQIGKQDFADPAQREFAEFWLSRRDQIRRLIDRTDALARRLREASNPLVLCHGDLHSRNTLLEGDQLWVVDWDETIMALKERDLMFFIGGVARLIDSRQTQCFLRGYGDTSFDPIALTYYRHAWAMQDVGALGERVFLMPELSDESRRDAVSGFMGLFEPGCIVALAFEADEIERSRLAFLGASPTHRG